MALSSYERLLVLKDYLATDRITIGTINVQHTSQNEKYSLLPVIIDVANKTPRWVRTWVLTTWNLQDVAIDIM